jgi:hypothetical protein
MPENRQDPLKSTETVSLARELSNQQIKIIADNQELGGKIIADRLQKLRDAVWTTEGMPKEQQKLPSGEQETRQKQVFSDAVAGLNNTQKEQLLSSYARMGHLYEIASLSARGNYFDSITRNGEPIPGGIEALTRENGNTNKPVAEIVNKLNQPVFEVIMTAHPTNVNSLESMKAQREIGKALEEHDQKTLTKALTEYQKTPLLHQVNGKDANLSVHDETKTALYFLGNIYEDLPKAYKNYDDALAKHAEKTGSGYDPSSLNLKAKFGSWGSSGDKDGNNKVTAESTLEAIALHTQAILTRYSKDLGEMSSPDAVKWKRNFDNALNNVNALLPEIAQIRQYSESGNAPPAVLSERFDQLSEKLAVARNSLNGKEFEKDLEKSAKGNTEENKKALNLLRRFRTFGFSFSKIEYRETAEAYCRVVGELVEGYKDLMPYQKVEKLTELLQKPNNVAAEFFKENESKIIEGAGKHYDKKSAKPIAYHTLKRMALARDFGDVIKDNVLAECGQLKTDGRSPTDKEIIDQGIANILEAQFLQRAVAKNGKSPKLGIIPLFEEPDTMTHIDKIVGGAYENGAYKKHLEAVKEANGAEKLTQQVMIAHSDNARRSGLQAARAYIHIAHHKMRELNRDRQAAGKEAIQTQFFEGGSISDAYRNGVRAVSASVNAFGLHDFAKFTFQGGDLLNFFNHPASIVRTFDRQISHQARPLEQENGTWAVRVRGANERTPNIEIEKNVNRALKQTLLDYRNNDFTQETMGVLLAALNYKKVIEDSNAGSRAGERSSAFAAGSTTTVGAMVTAKEVNNAIEFTPVPIEDVRTIGFSKTWQGAGIVPSWVGSLDLKKRMDSVFKKKEFNDVTKTGIPRAELTPESLKKIYDQSPTFRDAQDRSAFALALTDMDSAMAIANKKLLINDGDSEQTKKYKEFGSFYLERIQETYKAAAELAYSSLTGNALHASNLSNGQIREKMIEALPNLREDVTNKTNYRAALLHWQINNPDLFADPHMGRIAQAAKDTVEHGRWLGAGDPATARHRAASGQAQSMIR